MTIKEVATAFSSGKFDITYPHIATNAHWTIVGDSGYVGKNAIEEQCKKVAAYFKTVDTLFSLHRVIVDSTQVVIEGTAEFSKNNKRLSFVYACDLYEFDKDYRLTKITSYCIPQQ